MPVSGFGAMLNALREQRRFSLREVAQLAGVDHAYIHRLEKGEKESPSDNVLSRLVKVLKPDGRQTRMLRYLAEYPQADPVLVLHVLQDLSIDYEVFEAAAATSFRGTARPEPAKLIARIQRILRDEDDNG